MHALPKNDAAYFWAWGPAQMGLGYPNLELGCQQLIIATK